MRPHVPKVCEKLIIARMENELHAFHRLIIIIIIIIISVVPLGT
jgi:hypothetical protein